MQQIWKNSMKKNELCDGVQGICQAQVPGK